MMVKANMNLYEIDPIVGHSQISSKILLEKYSREIFFRNLKQLRRRKVCETSMSYFKIFTITFHNII